MENPEVTAADVCADVVKARTMIEEFAVKANRGGLSSGTLTLTMEERTTPPTS